MREHLIVFYGASNNSDEDGDKYEDDEDEEYEEYLERIENANKQYEKRIEEEKKEEEIRTAMILEEIQKNIDNSNHSHNKTAEEIYDLIGTNGTNILPYIRTKVLLESWDLMPNEFDKLSIKYWKTAFNIIAESGEHNMSHTGSRDIRNIFVPMVSIVAMMCLSDPSGDFTPFFNMFQEIARNRELNLLELCRDRRIQEKHFDKAAGIWIKEILDIIPKTKTKSYDSKYFVETCQSITIKILRSLYDGNEKTHYQKMNPKGERGFQFIKRKKEDNETYDEYFVSTQDVLYISHNKPHLEYTGSFYMLHYAKFNEENTTEFTENEKLFYEACKTTHPFEQYRTFYDSEMEVAKTSFEKASSSYYDMQSIKEKVTKEDELIEERTKKRKEAIHIEKEKEKVKRLKELEYEKRKKEEDKETEEFIILWLGNKTRFFDNPLPQSIASQRATENINTILSLNERESWWRDDHSINVWFGESTTITMYNNMIGDTAKKIHESFKSTLVANNINTERMQIYLYTMYNVLKLLKNDMEKYDYDSDYIEKNYNHIFNTVIPVSHLEPNTKNKTVGKLLSLKNFDNTLKIYLRIHENL